METKPRMGKTIKVLACVPNLALSSLILLNGTLRSPSDLHPISLIPPTKQEMQSKLSDVMVDLVVLDTLDIHDGMVRAAKEKPEIKRELRKAFNLKNNGKRYQVRATLRGNTCTISMNKEGEEGNVDPNLLIREGFIKTEEELSKAILRFCGQPGLKVMGFGNTQELADNPSNDSHTLS